MKLIDEGILLIGGTPEEWKAFEDYCRLTGFSFAYAPRFDSTKSWVKVQVLSRESEAVTSFLEIYNETNT